MIVHLMKIALPWFMPAVASVCAAALLASAACAATDANGAGQPPKADAQQVLSRAMDHMNKKEFDQARSMLKAAIQKDPANELLWITYDSCVRSDIQNAPLPPVIATPDERPAGSASTAEVSLAAANDGAARGYEERPDVSMLIADFSSGAACGDLACILNENLFSFIKSGDSSFLMLRQGESSGAVTFSFNIRNFPRRILLELSNRTVKKDRFKAAMPLSLSVNDTKAALETVRLGNKLETSSIDVTNLCRTGANIVTLTIEKNASPYLLKSARLVMHLRD